VTAYLDHQAQPAFFFKDHQRVGITCVVDGCLNEALDRGHCVRHSAC
jgi:hypothetical protein